jgi:hypothetical protein
MICGFSQSLQANAGSKPQLLLSNSVSSLDTTLAKLLTAWIKGHKQIAFLRSFGVLLVPKLLSAEHIPVCCNYNSGGRCLNQLVAAAAAAVM